MKKNFIIFALLTISLAFAACNNKKNDAAAKVQASADSTQLAMQKDSVRIAAAATKSLDNYEEFVNKVLDVTPKMLKGDVAATSEYSKLIAQGYEVMDSVTKYRNKFTSDQAFKYGGLAKKYVDAILLVTQKNDEKKKKK